MFNSVSCKNRSRLSGYREAHLCFVRTKPKSFSRLLGVTAFLMRHHRDPDTSGRTSRPEKQASLCTLDETFSTFPAETPEATLTGRIVICHGKNTATVAFLRLACCLEQNFATSSRLRAVFFLQAQGFRWSSMIYIGCGTFAPTAPQASECTQVSFCLCFCRIRVRAPVLQDIDKKVRQVVVLGSDLLCEVTAE